MVVRVDDAKGNLTGPDANLVLLVQDIPGLFYQVNDTNSLVIKLPESGEYRIELQGTRSGNASLHVWNYDQDRVTRTIQYLKLPTSTSSLGLLEVNDSFITARPPCSNERARPPRWRSDLRSSTRQTQ